MIEIIMVVAAIALMAKIADAEDRSGLLWGSATAGITIVALFLLPWPFVRVFLAALGAFVAMLVANMIQRG